MKYVNKIKDKKRKGIQKPKMKPKKEKVLIVAQEIKFARLLSGNEKKTRDRVLKSFKKWLLSCFDRGHEFKEDDFIRVWKGLFYAVWMSDKPLVQEELCETIAGILDLFPPKKVEYAFLMFKAGFKVLATEWYGIDHHRMDKFLMLVRRYLRGSLRCVARCKWETDVCKMYADTLAGTDGILSLTTPLYARNAGSMLLHVIDCFLEEISKVSAGDIPGGSVAQLLRPLCALVAGGASRPLCEAARRLLTQLLRQSDRGLEYRERTRAWQQMGCPRGGPDALQPACDDEDAPPDGDRADRDEGEKALDPRAGRVNVTLHPVPVPAAELADVLRQLLAGAGSRAHKRTKICLQRFEALAKDEYPLRVADVRVDSEAVPRRGAAAASLRTLEKTLLASSDELALRGLSRKHRKRLLAQSRAGRSIVADGAPQADITSTNGDWAVEATVSKTYESTDKHTDKANKENVNKKKSKKRKHADAQTDRLGKRNRNNTKEQEKAKISKDTRTDKTVAVVGENKIVSSNKKDKLKETDSKPPAVEKAKTVNNKKDDKTKQTDKHVTAKQNSLINGVVGKPKSEKVNRNVSKQKFSKNESVKDKNKIINGRVEKTQQDKLKLSKKVFGTPKKVKFVLKNNSTQGAVDYYKSVRQSPSIPFDGARKPSKTNLKVSTPSPINPFFKKKLRMK